MRSIRSATILMTAALAAVLAMGAPAVAQEYGRNPVAQARQYGYENGYRDGVDRGRHEGRENDPFDYRTPDWRQASRGYQPWMGPLSVFQQGYQQGYASGFHSGFVSVRPGYREDYRPAYSGGSSSSIGYSTGYQDGAQTAREDLYHNKPYNPNPRGRYDDLDHGYRREYGDKNYYRSQYDAGYRTGYSAVFDRRY
jgi:flagellar biosynthesis/type III secretory pathway protein FliH